jgi:cytochrome P450
VVSADERLPNVADEPREPARHVIVSARISAPAELIRWLFERYQIPYRDEAHAPRLGRFATRRRQAGAEVPVVVSAEAAWTGWPSALDGLDSKLRDTERLFLGSEDERRRSRELANRLFELLHPAVERLVLFHLLPHRAVCYPMVTENVPWWERVVVWAAYPLWRRRVAASLDLSRQAIDVARRQISEAASLIEQMLTPLSTPFLAGREPGPIDMVFAALVAPLVAPAEYGARLPALDQLPAELRTLVEELRRRRAGRLVLETYAAARPGAEARARLFKNRSGLKRLWIGPGLLRIGAGIAARIGRVFVFGKTALVVRWSDVAEVLSIDTTYKVGPINARKVNTVTGHFVLGLDRGARFANERPRLYEAVAAIDVEDIRARVAREADRLLADALAGSGRIDVGHGYARLVAARTAVRLFGIAAPCETDLLRVCRSLFNYIFLDVKNKPDAEREAIAASHELNAWIDEEIARRRRAGRVVDDVLGRLLANRARPGEPLDDEGVRRNLSGLLIGSIDTTSVATALIVAVIGADPVVLAQVERDVDDRERMTGWCREALRMWPHNPTLLRKAGRTGSIQGKTIPEGALVVAYVHAAMFDPSVFPNPRRLDPMRPRGAYFNFGGGLHPCAGRSVNDVQLPTLVGAVVRRGIDAVEKPRYHGPFLDQLVVRFRKAPA